MERFSSKHKIKIDFDIAHVPSNLEGAKVVADVEGDLTVYINDNTFFIEENILLLEFAIILNRWLRDIQNNKFTDLYYESMNYEDQPILRFTHSTEQKYSIYSVWQEFKSDDFVDLMELLEVVSDYIEKLKRDLQDKFNLNVSDFLN